MKKVGSSPLKQTSLLQFFPKASSAQKSCLFPEGLNKREVEEENKDEHQGVDPAVLPREEEKVTSSRCEDDEEDVCRPRKRVRRNSLFMNSDDDEDDPFLSLYLSGGDRRETTPTINVVDPCEGFETTRTADPLSHLRHSIGCTSLEETCAVHEARRKAERIFSTVQQNPSEKFPSRTSPADAIETSKRRLLQTPVAEASFYFRQYIDLFYTHSERSDISFPPWLHPENLRDKDGRRPSEEAYDVTTMMIPGSASREARSHPKHTTPAMLQYWEIKRTNFDSVVLFKMGRFYEIFYIDACIANRECDLRWMGGDEKPHVGFPEVSLHFHASTLVASGFRVIVVEQMETPKELEERNRKTEGKKSKAVHREICEVFTRGTVTHPEMLSVEARWTLALVFDEFLDRMRESVEDGGKFSFGLCLADTSTCCINFGWVDDAADRGALQTLLAKVSPVELLIFPSKISSDVLHMLKNLPNSPLLTTLPSFSSEILIEEAFGRYGEGGNPQILSQCKQHESSFLAAAGLSEYLHSIMLDRQVLSFAHYDWYNLAEEDSMLLNATTLRNLEILLNQEGTEDHSLVHFLNQTKTPFGSRLLRRWICSPLLDIQKIEKRLDVVGWFIRHSELAGEIQNVFSKLPDLERQITRLAYSALQSERGAVYFDFLPSKKLGQVVGILSAFDDLDSLFSKVETADGPLPQRLQEILLGCEGLSNASEDIRRRLAVDAMGEWGAAKGWDEEYDRCSNTVEDIKKKLDQELEEIIVEFKLNSNHVRYTTSKFRYEVEVPEGDITKRKQQEIDVTSTKKGFIRFRTESIVTLVDELEDAEQKLRDQLYPFMQNLFLYFYTHHYCIFTRAVRVAAELDVLIGFAICSSRSVGGPMCRPVVVETPSGSSPFLELRNCRHPMVASTLSTGFIPNDVLFNVNGAEKNIFLLTGANMGGKSTLLRQVCLCVIIAQVGCFVPASKCELSRVDKIFTRIGATDLILEGKSTFFIELEEISTLLHQATRHSLCIVDELGRGTSTFDGTAIALATLEHLSHHIQCRCLFSTHYHILCEKAEDLPGVANHHMSISVVENKEDSRKVEEVTFTYKLTPGPSAKSHGLNVARLAGLPQEILRNAAEKGEEFEVETAELKRLARVFKMGRKIVDAFEEATTDKRQILLKCIYESS